MQTAKAIRALDNMAHVRKTWRKRETELAQAVETRVHELAREMAGTKT
jgi:hypothetical protein